MRPERRAAARLPDGASNSVSMGRDRTAPFHVDAEQLQRLARDAGVELVARQCEQLLAYGTLLRHWNRVHNLTAIDDDRALLTHHLLDSLAIVRPIEEALARFSGTATPPAFLDAGSGAGLPGIVLAIARPAWSGRLVDAVEKKCAFLQQCLLELGLPRLTVHHARLESFALESNQPAPDLIVSRAFAALPQMTGVTQHLLAPAGLWAAMKGKLPETELAALPADIEVLDTITLRVPLLEEQRHLVLLRRREAAPMPASPAARSPRR